MATKTWKFIRGLLKKDVIPKREAWEEMVFLMWHAQDGRAEQWKELVGTTELSNSGAILP